MIETILSFVGGIKGLVIGIGSLIGGAWLLLMKRKFDKQRETIATQERVIQVHQAKEKSHEHDGDIDAQTAAEITKVREAVNNAETSEQAAGEVSNALNDYFGGENK